MKALAALFTATLAQLTVLQPASLAQRYQEATIPAKMGNFGYF